MLLEITAQGLGGVWLGVAPVVERMNHVESVLGIGGGLRAFAMIPVGYPAEERPREERYFEDRIHRI